MSATTAQYDAVESAMIALAQAMSDVVVADRADNDSLEEVINYEMENLGLEAQLRLELGSRVK